MQISKQNKKLTSKGAVVADPEGIGKVHLFHLMHVPVALIALNAEIKVITDTAMITCLAHLTLAVVARVREAVVVAGVQLIKHRHAGKLCSPKAREFVMFVAGQS